jgi:sugar phosphate isomerase/epimerase
MKIALDTICLAKRPVEEAIDVAVKTGYESVELYSEGWAGRHVPSSMSRESVRELKRKLDDAGLSCSALSTYVGGNGFNVIAEDEILRQMEDCKKYIAIAHVLECPSLRAMAGSKRADEMARSAKLLERFANLDPDINFMVEIHFGALIESAEDAVRYLDPVVRENVGVIYDPGNMAVNGAEFGADDVRRLGKRLLHAHIKDMAEVPPETPGSFKYRERAFAWVPMGRGKVKYGEIFEAMAEMRYGGYLSIECEGTAKGMTLEEILIHEREEVTRLVAVARGRMQ